MATWRARGGHSGRRERRRRRGREGEGEDGTNTHTFQQYTYLPLPVHSAAKGAHTMPCIECLSTAHVQPRHPPPPLRRFSASALNTYLAHLLPPPPPPLPPATLRQSDGCLYAHLPPPHCHTHRGRLAVCTPPVYRFCHRDIYRRLSTHSNACMDDTSTRESRYQGGLP